MGAYATVLAVADLNNDGIPDAVSNDGDNNVLYILLGNGDGTFQPPQTILGVDASGVAIGDFNRDGKADLAVTTYSLNLLSAYLDNGDGSLAVRGDRPASAGRDDFRSRLHKLWLGADAAAVLGASRRLDHLGNRR